MSAVQQMLVAYGAGAACDPYFGYVSLLLHMDGTNGSTAFTDNSPSPKTVTSNGNTLAEVSTSVVKYGTGSCNFKNSNNYLRANAIASEFDFGTGDFTVEFWVNWSTVDDSGFVSGNEIGSFDFAYVSGSLRVGRINTAWDTDVTWITPTTGVWYHIAYSRSGTNLKIFVNGIQVTPTSTNSTNYAASLVNVGLSRTVSDDRPFKGYMDDLRITKGVARYTANFTPPAAAFPDIICAGGDPYYYSVKLLLHMDGSNGSTTFTDNSPSPKTLTPSGNAQVNTSVVKYGTGSYVGDGSGDYLTATVPGGLGSSDFTIEYWVYPLVVSGFVLNSRTSGTGADGIDLSVAAGVQTASQQILPDYSAFVPINTWTYIAIVRQGSTWYRFFNGTLYDTGTNANNFTGTDFKIGGSPHGNVGYINGYIDDFRITVGVARYTTNFTPPTGPFPNS